MIDTITDVEVEKEIQNKNLNTPRVSLDNINDFIVDESYTVLPNGRTTVCNLKMANDFTVIGYSSCVSRENFDAAIGKRIAKTEAVNKCWELFGFVLACEVSGKYPIHR